MRFRNTLAVLGMAVLAGACSSGGGSPLTTGSLFGSSQKVQVDSPALRATQAAQVSVNARRCGYNYDPARIRASYLAYEAGQGTPPDALGKAEKIYDTTRATELARKINADDLCTEDLTPKIKAALAKQLAGDFSLPEKKPEVNVSSFSNAVREPFDREKALHPTQRD